MPRLAWAEPRWWRWQPQERQRGQGASEDDRSLFDLLWYQGLTMAETSELLAVPLRTLGRRWKLVRVRLYRDLLSEPGEAEFE